MEASIQSLKVETVSFAAADGWRLNGTLFSFTRHDRSPGANSANPQGALISSATGVPRSFYSRFAAFVAQETGWPVLTYDYRGNEGVLPDAKRNELPHHPLVDISADISDWALLDQPAALSYLLAYLRNLPIVEDAVVSGAVLNPEVVIVGHSVGGHIAPLLAPHLAAHVPRVLFVSVNNAYFRHHQSKAQLATFAYLRVAVPILIAMHGYAPTQKVGLKFGELPSGVMEQWLRWASEPDYCFSEAKLKALGEAWPGKVLGISFADDEIAKPSAFPAFTNSLKSARVVNVHLEPSDVGLDGRIGHVGFFHDRCRGALWTAVIEYIKDGRTPASLLHRSAVPVQLSRL